MNVLNPKVTRDPAKRWDWVITQLKGRSNSLARIARDINVSRSAVQCAKYAAYPRVDFAIAKALGVLVHELFPERYDEDGISKGRPVGRPKKSLDKTLHGIAGSRNRRSVRAKARA